MKQRCAFITMDSMEGWVCDDDLAIPELAKVFSFLVKIQKKYDQETTFLHGP